MVEINSNTYTVKSGDCAWKVAKQNLKGKKNVTSQDIQKEMQRLAKQNNCDSVEDFNQKFFARIGSKFNNEKTAAKEKPTTTSPTTRPVPAKIDSSRVMNRIDSLQSDTMISKTDNTRVAILETPDSLKRKVKKPIDPFQKEATHINNIKSDLGKIIEYNKTHAKGNYVVVDKKTCKATIYNKNGKALESFEVLLGATRGDDYSTAFAKDKYLADNGRRTVPGEYDLGKRTSQHGGLRTTGVGSETADPDIEFRDWLPGAWGKTKFNVNNSFQAIHGTAGESRKAYYHNENLADNRQSMGCVNIPLEDLDKMEQKYGISTNSKLYILPETKGNELKLIKRKDGVVKFVTEYRDPVQNDKRDRIQNRIADKNIQRDLAAKKREAAKAEQERLLAEQNEFHLLKPSTWGNLFS